MLFSLVVCLTLAADQRETTVGMETTLSGIVLPGTELEVKPLENRKSPLVLRIVECAPHGTAFRYTLSVYGLEPGTYNLASELRRKDGSPVDNLPEMIVTVKAILPPGHILPNDLEAKSSPFIGGYRLVIVAASVLWIAGLLAIALIGRKKKIREMEATRGLTLADRLRPLVEKGLRGELSMEQRADLERALLGYWKKRLQLENQKPAAAFATLRQHSDAGPLLNQLEAWLHRPGPAEKNIDLASLLRPYQDLPADALQLSPEGAAV